MATSIAGWEVLHPPSGDRLPKADDNATVLAREVHGVRLLLLSDLGEAGQADLAGSGLDLRSDIVVASMPGVGEPLGQALLDAIAPGAIVLSAGTYPYAEIPSPALLERLAKRGVPVFNTVTDGGDRNCSKSAEPASGKSSQCTAVKLGRGKLNPQMTQIFADK